MFDSKDVAAGDKLAMWNRQGVARVEVLRLTPTMLVLTNGIRFSRKDGREVGASTWGFNHHLDSLENDAVKAQFLKQAFNNSMKKLEAAAAALRKAPSKDSLDEVKRLTAKVEEFLTA